MGEVLISSPENVKNVDPARTKSGSTKSRQYFAGITAGIASFAYGNVIGWMSPTLPLLQDPTHPAVGDSPITNEEASWMGSLMFLGALASSPVFSYVCHHYGRKTAGYLTSLPVILSWILIIFANSAMELYIARFLAGIMFGGVVAFIPLYCGEIAEDSIRGSIGVILPMFCNIGTLATYVIGPFVSFTVLGIFSLLVPFLFLFGFYWMPETPLFLVTKGKIQEAEKSLRWLRGKNATNISDEVKNLQDLVKTQLKTDSPGTLKDNLLSRGTRRALIISIVVCLCQQCTGVFAVLNYCLDILSLSGSELSPEITSIFVAAVQVLGSLLSSMILDLLGRKTLLVVSQLSMTLCLGGLGTYFYFHQLESDLSSVTFVPATCLALYLFSIAVGLGPVTFVLISEIFHPDVRGIAMMTATTTMWSLAFIMTKFYPMLTEALGNHGCYWGFASVSAACLAFSLFQIPETKGKSLAEILRVMNGDKDTPNT